jgi:3-isopropylmalate/(R)-2-methylmalate dehydratase small subunit
MAREKFHLVHSSAVPVHIENVDTDQIIPARFLKATTRDGFGENLFRDWRYDSNNQPIADFVLNNSLYSGDILVSGKNFGCGSSREHAAWAITDFGFKVVVSSFFADIFKNNALKNRVLPIALPEVIIQQLIDWLQSQELETNESRLSVQIDLEHQTVQIAMGETAKASEQFELSAFWKTCLLHGIDDIGYTLQFKDQIAAYEQRIA